MSGDEIDAELRSFGGDPAAIRAKGAALAARLHEEQTGEGAASTATPLAWEASAQAKLDEVRKLAGTLRKTKLPRADLLAKVDAARSDPRVTKKVGALFRKRAAEESSDEELEMILEAIELLGKIEE